jgi:hypothetical protein
MSNRTGDLGDRNSLPCLHDAGLLLNSGLAYQAVPDTHPAESVAENLSKPWPLLPSSTRPPPVLGHRGWARRRLASVSKFAHCPVFIVRRTRSPPRAT